MWRIALVIAATLSSGSTLSGSAAPPGLRIRGPVLEPCLGSERDRVLRALILRGGEGSQEEAQPGDATICKHASPLVDEVCTLLDRYPSTLQT